MEHRKLSALLSPSERIAKVAAQGAKVSKGSQTSPSGAKSFDNADGTRTIIGEVQNGEGNPSYTMATHVGDETPPGVPTGITASCKSGVVVVEWDGTLTGGIPDDFYCVRVYLDGAELGALTEAGSVSSASLEAETVHSVTATAEDDCCLPDGTPAHNVSDPTTAVSVTVSQDAAGVAAIAEEALDVAEATGQHFWPDDDGIHVTEVTEEEWKEEGGPHFHSGMNVLINSLGQLFRNGLNNLLAIVAGNIPSVLFYDGQGNADANIIAKIQASAAEFARQFNWAVPSAGDVEFFGGLAGVHVESEPLTPEGETAPTVVDLTTSVDGQLDLLSDGYGSAGGALRVQQEVAKQGAGAFGQSVTTIEAAASNGTRSGFASLGVQASSSGSSAAKVAANTVLFQGSDGINITAQSMTEVANEFRTATKTLKLTNLGRWAQLTLTRRGHWVLAQMNNVVTPSTANSNITCGTVPTGYRPNMDAFYSGVGAVSTTLVGFFRWRVATAGTITFICSATGNRDCQILMYWYTDDDWPTS